MNYTLVKTINWEKEPDYQDIPIRDVVKSALKVIAPLGPINTFAARNPWVGLEDQPFEQVARCLKGTIDVDMYPDQAIYKLAFSKGEIREDFLKTSLHHWLNSQKTEMPFAVAERYCLSALMEEEIAFTPIDEAELKSLASKLSRFQSVITNKRFVQTYSKRLEMSQELDRQLIKWCKLFLDESQAVLSMPNREEGFYRAWRELIPYDPALDAKIRKQLKALPHEPDQAFIFALSELEVPVSEIQEYVEAHLLSLPGWAGMMLWRSQNSTAEADLIFDYLAVRICMEQAIINPYLPLTDERNDKVKLEPLILKWLKWGNLSLKQWSQLSGLEQKARLTLAYRFDRILQNRLWLEAWENTYEEQLKKTIQSKIHSKAVFSNKKKAAQFVFCIDVRSELFRRKLEQAGPFETFGTAGFFGLPIETIKLENQHSHNSLPVMFKPQFKIIESLPEFELKHYQQRQHAANSLGETFTTMKHNLLASWVLPEISGPWLSIQTLVRSFVPRRAGSVFRKLRKTWLQKPAATLTLDHTHTSETEIPIGFTENEKVQFVGQALKMMGLTDQFSPLVVICGHSSHSTNNPYKSALDCGACGGASSGFNARVLAELCNRREVRQSLAAEGIVIPKDTVFAAAEHITTLDELRWLYVPELSDIAKESFKQVQSVLPKVCEDANAERIKVLPVDGTETKSPREEAQRLAEDWSEVRPEWGLARNAAFIIGERALTKECNLKGRVFLQNYNWRKDKNGAWLKNIILGPATVAQWINLQYYASTVAPHYYGSGNKATQTVTAGLGVMQGNASDLLPGLPWQSVMKSDHEAYHAPLRLLVVIQAPKESVKRLLDSDSAFQQKVQNGWIRLASIGPDGNWETWS